MKKREGFGMDSAQSVLTFGIELSRFRDSDSDSEVTL
jgi:hypothetical protein